MIEIVLLVILLFFLIVINKGDEDMPHMRLYRRLFPENYITGNEPTLRGSPMLTGWNLSSLYYKRPIIVDDLTPL